MFRPDLVETATGWRVAARRVAASTNDLAREAIEGGTRERWVAVADRQTSGRGRGGRTFASPAGGLYASAVVTVTPDLLPAPLVGAVAVSLAEAIESAAPGVAVRLKWPNDLWIEGRKVGGILVEAVGGRGAGTAQDGVSCVSCVSCVVGVGINVSEIPGDLPPEVARESTALDLHAAAPVAREALLSAWLSGLDRELARVATQSGLADIETRYRARAALVGERVRYLVGEVAEEGVLRDLSLVRGILVERAGGSVEWRPMAHVSEVRRVPS